jgi:hypothetical protein
MYEIYQTLYFRGNSFSNADAQYVIPAAGGNVTGSGGFILEQVYFSDNISANSHGVNATKN